MFLFNKVVRMNSKALIFLGFLFAVLLTISSATETKYEKQADGEEVMNQVDDSKYYCQYGCCGSGLYGRCIKCCSHASKPQVQRTKATPEKVDGEEGTNQVDDAKYYCKYGCCGYGLYGRCSKCCSHAGEPQVHRAQITPEKERSEEKGTTGIDVIQDDNHGGHGGGSGGGSGGGKGGGGSGGGGKGSGGGSGGGKGGGGSGGGGKGGGGSGGSGGGGKGGGGKGGGGGGSGGGKGGGGGSGGGGKGGGGGGSGGGGGGKGGRGKGRGKGGGGGGGGL